MSLCPKCQKPVYFAERRTSLGKEWHRECLTCEECGRVLHPGQHAEHKGIPYCNVPCYSALFGPTMFGHGSTVEAHTNFGRQAGVQNSPLKRPDLEARIRYYNEHCDSSSLSVKSKEVNGRLVLEGALAVYWGVVNPISLQPKDKLPQVKDKEEWRKSYCMAINNGLDEDFLQTLDNGGETLRARRNSVEEAAAAAEQMENQRKAEREKLTSKYNTIAFRGEKKRKKVSRRWSMINGHVFDVETSTFTPAHGSMTNVTINSLDTAPEVIKMLLEKFKVMNDPKDFCLSSVKKSGETCIMEDTNCPLLERVLMGPVEDECKVFIMEKHRVHTISQEVAQFVNLPEAVLVGFLEKLRQEEMQEIRKAKERYVRYKQELQRRLSEISTQM